MRENIMKQIILTEDEFGAKAMINIIQVDENNLMYVLTERTTTVDTIVYRTEIFKHYDINTYITEEDLNKDFYSIINDKEIVQAIKDKAYITTVYIIYDKRIYKGILLKKNDNGISYYVDINDKVLKIHKNKIFKHKRKAKKVLNKYY